MSDDILAHFGVKGMKWGVRKQRTSGRDVSPKAKREPMSREQKLKVASVVGTTLIGVAVAAVLLKEGGDTAMKDISENLAKAGEKQIDELSDLAMATRGVHEGFRFLKTGGLREPIVEISRSDTGFDGNSSSIDDAFVRYGDGLEKIRARIMDPEGRNDRTGRPISHEFLIPKDLAKDINSIQDVKDKIWPMVEKEYDTFYESSKVPFYDRK